MIGRTIGHYEIIEKIGEGGMGAVYKARDIRLDRSVALKMLPGEAVANSERKRRFALEAKAASALNHPNIITIYDIDVADGVDFIAMEYVAGHTLAEVIPPDGMEPARAIAVRSADRRRAGDGPPVRDRPPGPEALEHHGERAGAGEGAGLRPGEADRAGVRRGAPPTPRRRKPARGRSWAPCPTWLPSRLRASQWTSGPISSASARCSTRC